MKLTALDIHHKEFRHSLRGYSEEEVDAFLDQVADEVDRLFKENIDLAEKLEQANERVRGYQSMEATLNNTLVSAQRSAEEIVSKASLDADSMMRDAEIKAKEIVHNALQRKQTVANELIRIKQAEEEFRARYKSLLETQLRDVNEIALPSDVNVLLDDSDGLIGTVDVRPAALAPDYSTTAFTPLMEAAPVSEAVPVEDLLPSDTTPDEGGEPTGVFDAAFEVGGDLPQAEPPASGFVSSVTLGEMEAPEMPEGPLELADPLDIELPGFEAFGERESDTDIEEID